MEELIVKNFTNRILSVKPKINTIYLFGSRARGDEKPDSDYDFLLVVKESFTLDDKSKLYDAVLEILLETGRVISLKIFKEKEFQRLCGMKTPFMQNIFKEGVKIE